MSAAAFFIYLAQASLYAGIMWGIYCAVWRGKPLLRGSRIYLLCSLLLPLLLPLIRLPIAENSRVAAYRFALPEVIVGQSGAVSHHGGFPWLLACLWAYGCCAAILLLLYVRAYLLLFQKLSRGKSSRCDDYTIITGAGIGPGTIGKRIFFPGHDVNEAILRHELGHVRAGHRYDAALLQALHVAFWASPAHWLIRRELKLVHEYEADRAAVPATEDMASYGELMLSQSLGADNISIAHSFFHHPLKLRIKMLQNAQHLSRRRRVYIIASVLIILFSGAVVLAQTKKAKSSKLVSRNRQLASGNDTLLLEDIATGKQQTMIQAKGERPFSGRDTIIIEDPVTGEYKTKLVKAKSATIRTDGANKSVSRTKTLPDGRAVFETVEQNPEFNGNLNEWMASHLAYPDSARLHNQQGRVGIQFVVNEDGRVSDVVILRSSAYPLLDAEAVRAISLMPRWKAGRNAGQPVPVSFTMPVSFTLDK